MIIHCYFTEGLTYYALLLLESFKYHNGEKYKFVLTTRDLNEKQEAQLRNKYNNLDIINKPINWQKICTEVGFNKSKILNCKKEVETRTARHIKPDLVKWKQYISIKDRYRDSITEVMKKYPDAGHILHFDADMYVRKPLDDLFTLIERNDFTITFRLDTGPEWRRVFGCLLGIAVNEKGFLFMDTWRKYIDDIPLAKTPFGYGQTSCYYTYKELKYSDISWGNIPEEYIGKSMEENAAIWSGNNVKHGKTKIKDLSLNDFKKIKKEKLNIDIFEIKNLESLSKNEKFKIIKLGLNVIDNYINDKSNVIDINAGKGEFSENILKIYNCNVYALEATSLFSELNKLKQNYPKFNCINAALRLKKGVVEIKDVNGKNKKIKAFDLNAILNQYKKVAVLKISNLENELAIINFTKSENLLKCKQILIDFKSKDNNTIEKAKNRIKRLGYYPYRISENPSYLFVRDHRKGA